MRYFYYCVIIVLLFVLSCTVMAELDGNGEATTPYLIQSLDDFKEFADVNTAWKYWESGIHTRLMCDLYLTNEDYTTAIIAADTSTSNGFQGTSYRGQFDGGGHIIHDLQINTNGGESSYVGLFGYIDGADAGVRNLVFENVSIQIFSGECIGVVAGLLDRGFIENCEIRQTVINNNEGKTGGVCGVIDEGNVTLCTVTETTVNGYNYVGGIVGWYSGGGRTPKGQMDNCSFSGTVTGINYVGGICGGDIGRIIDCHCEGTVQGTQYIGGFVGTHSGDYGVIEHCISSCTVEGSLYVGGFAGRHYGGITTSQGIIANSYASGDVTGGDFVGGFVGYNKRQIATSFATGNVTGNDRVGGLVGYTDVQFRNCYARGDVEGNDYVGGLIGDGFMGVQFCYATGKVTGQGASVGGLFGYVQYPGQTYKSFWDTETSGQSTSPDGTGLSTSLMQTYDTYMEWENENCWVIDEGVDYPHFVWEGTPGTFLEKTYIYGGGSGTAQDPYLIATAEHLAMISHYHSDFTKHFKVTSPIDMSGYDGQDGRPSFNPIGFMGFPFAGVFDGNDMVISNLSVHSEGGWAGLFGWAGDSTERIDVVISHVQLENAYVENTNGEAGSLAGLVTRGVVNDCSSINCTVIGTTKAGGLIGNAAEHGTSGSAEVNHCVVSGTVIGDTNIGGIAGYSKGELYQCYFEGSVSGSSTLGGLCGLNEFRVDSCGAKGTVEGTGTNVGGLIGSNEGPAVYSYAECDVYGSYNVGGLVGILDENDMILSCYAQGRVFGDRSGGLVGCMLYHSKITECYAACEVQGSEYIGGLIGRSGSETIEKCFWDVEISGLEVSAGGTGKTSAEMKEAETYLTWECSEVWTLDEGNDYPRLAWENAPGDLISPANYGGGSGEPDDPFLIYTAEDLYKLTFRPCQFDKCFRLMADINMQDYDGQNDRLEFPGIATQHYFNGTFDGCGFVIYNLTSSLPLFGIVGEKGVLRNIHLENFSIHCVESPTGSSVFSGALCGYSNGCLEHCSVESSLVEGVDNVGGLLGYNTGLVKNCYSDATVQSVTSDDDSFGGLIGGLGSGTVINCFASGSVTGNGRVGGLVGYVNSGRFICSYSTGRVSGSGDLGGLIGSKRTASFYACFWDINSSGQAVSAGGEGKTTLEMKTASTYKQAGWDFAGVREDGILETWTLSGGQDYPIQSIFTGYNPPVLKGSGTPNDPYEVSNACELGAIYYYPINAVYIVTGNIDFSGIEWKIPPVPEFWGEYDGGGYSVVGLYVDGSDELGFFGCIKNNAKIKNLCIGDANITGADSLGLLVGKSLDSTIEYCHVEGNIDGNNYLGGLIGYCLDSTIVSSSTVVDIGNTIANENLGGLIGNNLRGSISMSCSSCSITGSERIGGFLGYNDSGSVQDCYTTSELVGDSVIAGFVGGNRYGQYTNCYAAGSVNGGSITYGFSAWIHGTFNSCYFLESIGPTNGRGIPLTDEQMKSESSFEGWDFATPVWMIEEGVCYPYLWWELKNTPPIADAGEDVSGWADWMGLAEIELDGSGSSDEDGDELTYLWTWEVDGVGYEAAGEKPVVELPVGEHVITLVVNDGQADSEPDEVVVTVEAMQEVEMQLTPAALNPGSHGQWVKAHFVMAEGVSFDIDMDAMATAYPMEVVSEKLERCIGFRGALEYVYSFSRSEFSAALPAMCDEVAVHVVGYMADGRPFYGTDTIRIVGFAGLMSHWLGTDELPGWDGDYDCDGDAVINLMDFSLIQKE